MKFRNRFLFLIGMACLSAGRGLLAQTSRVLHGRVLDARTGKPLFGAEVFIADARVGTTTDREGRFSLQLPSQSVHHLTVRFIGYRAQMVEMNGDLPDTEPLVIRLQPTILAMPPVEVMAARETFDAVSRQVQPSVTRIDTRALRFTPTFGEADLFRALDLLPGVTTPNQAVNQPYIRGGSPDQNLLLLNGMRLYSAYHLFGLAANINPDVVENVTVSAGGFGARYGEAMSGVIDVRSHSSRSPLRIRGSVSLVSSRITVRDGSHPRFAWLVSARRSYHDAFARLIGEKLLYYFYDLLSTATWRPHPHHRLQFTAFHSRDVLRHEEETSFPLFSCREPSPNPIGEVRKRQDVGFPWKNTSVGLQWDFFLTPRLQLTSRLSASGVKNQAFDRESISYFPNAGHTAKEMQECYEQSASPDKSIDDRLTNYEAGLQLYWNLSPAFRLHAGAEWAQLQFDYAWQNFDTEGDDIVLHFDFAPETFAYQNRYVRRSAFLESILSPTDYLQIQPGLRLDHRAFSRTLTLDPRVSLRLGRPGGRQFKLAAGYYRQGLTYLRERGVFAVHELFFPASEPPRSFHAIAGLEWPLPGGNLRIEGYWKSFRDIPVVDRWPIIRSARGRAYGIEIYLQRKHLRLIYAWSHVQRLLPDEMYDTPWDIRHRVQIIDQWHLGKGWELSWRWDFHTGQPYSPFMVTMDVPTYHFDRNGNLVPGAPQSKRVLYPQGSIRYPVYHRLDITLQKRLKLRGRSFAPYFQILNVYNRHNPLYYETSHVPTDDSFTTFALQFKPVSVPFLPSLGVNFSF